MSFRSSDLFVIVAVIILSFVPVGLWISAIAAGVRVSIVTLIGMRLRRVPPSQIILPLIKAEKAGLEASIDKLEAHYLAGGNVDRVVDALIAAHRAEIHLTFERAAAIDLAGRDVLEAVQTSVNPKVIDCPDPPGRRRSTAWPRTASSSRSKARVTVRTNIDRLVGGATEETIIARVGEGIVTTDRLVRDATRTCWRTPTRSRKRVLAKGLDAGTAFEILSIDIADIDVGRQHRRPAPGRPSRGRQEDRPGQGRRAAVRRAAREQEMKAQVEENRAKVVEAEAEVPRAIAAGLPRRAPRRRWTTS